MTARLIVFDIETYRTRHSAVVEHVTQEARAKRPAKNVAKAVKTEWDTTGAREARVAQALERTAVDPLVAEPLCVCWSSYFPEASELQRMRTGAMSTMCPDGAGALALIGVDQLRCDHEGPALAWLAGTWDDIAGPETIWSGHNIAGFDLPILLNGWRRHGIVPPEHFPTFCRGHWRGRVYDTMERVPAKTPFVSLVDLCEAYGVDGAKSMEWRGEPLTGKRVGPAYEAAAYSMILEYCLSDVRVQRRLYMAMTALDTRGTWPADDVVAREIAEIEACGADEGARAIGIVNVLRQAGRLPRRAA